MNSGRDEIISFRIAKADEAFDLAKTAIDKAYFNSATSELYYTCFYLISALLFKNDYEATSHSAVKSMFGLHFVKQGIFDKKWARLFTTLFDRRNESDYRDFFVMEEAEVLNLYDEVTEFVAVIKPILKTQ